MLDECYIKLGELLGRQLRYKKEGSFSTAEIKPFDATIYGWKFITDVEKKSDKKIDSGCFYGVDTAKIVFIRKTERPVTITMEFTLGRVEVSKSDILSSGTAKEGEKVIKYSFDYPDNDDFYTEALALINTNRTSNKKLTTQEKIAKDDAEKEKMTQARKTFFDTQKKFNEMKKSDYTGDYSELSVNLFPYMSDSEKEKEVKGSDEPVVMVNFKDFKEEQEQLAEDTKKSIGDSSLEEQEKKSKKHEVDDLLKRIIDTQKELMLAVYLMNTFLGEYGGRVYAEQTQGALQNQFNQERGIVKDDSITMYSEVQKNIQKMKNLAANLTTEDSAGAPPADVVATEDSAAAPPTNVVATEGIAAADGE